MTRTLSPTLGAVVAELELEQPQNVTIDDLRKIATEAGLRTDVKVIAARLRERGWLLPTGLRGVWEFAPGAHAGAVGHGDPLGAVKAFSQRHPDVELTVCLSTAAWAGGYADRVPGRVEVAAAPRVPVPTSLNRVASLSRFSANLPLTRLKGVRVHRPESVLVHMAHHPSDVRSWASAAEWLPDVAADADAHAVEEELADRPASTRVRLGYLLQALRPDIAQAQRDAARTKVWFGPRGTLRRHSQAWLVADTLLPFDPAKLQVVA